MTAKGHHHDQPWWLWISPVLGLALFAAIKLLALPYSSAWVLSAVAVLLIGSVMSSVQHAEILALRVGQPFGSIILALAITVIEVGLIMSVMLSDSIAATTIARDTVFATIMIVLNGIVGLCLVAGGIRYHVQEFKIDGAAAILSVIATLVVLAFILPNFTVSMPGPIYSTGQLLFVGFVSLVLYLIFVFVQTVRHREYFVSPTDEDGSEWHPDGMTAAKSAVMLIVGLLSVIVLAKAISPFIERLVSDADLPSAFVGVVIAAIVLLPEGVAALKAALRNDLQSSLNASLGSVLASIGLTVPAVAVVAILGGQEIKLGVSPQQEVLVVLSLFVSMLSFATGRTTVLQGCVHLVIFGVFIVLSAMP